MDKGVIFVNPPAIVREGQQRRGMFPLPIIALADFLNQKVRVESVSPDLLGDYSSASTIVLSSNSGWVSNNVLSGDDEVSSRASKNC